MSHKGQYKLTRFAINEYIVNFFTRHCKFTKSFEKSLNNIFASYKLEKCMMFPKNVGKDFPKWATAPTSLPLDFCLNFSKFWLKLRMYPPTPPTEKSSFLREHILPVRQGGVDKGGLLLMVELRPVQISKLNKMF